MSKILRDLKVLDFTWAIAGPQTTKYLADHGATVIKVENATKLDMIRTFQPFKDAKFGINRSGVFNAMNSGKYSLGLDMGKPGGRAIAMKLAAWCDVLVENFAPGTVGDWGMSYDEVRKVNDDIVMISMSSMGQTGSMAHFHGLGFHLQGFAGFNQVTGFSNREPFGSIPYTDFVGPPFALTAIMGALDRRRRTGQGIYIDLSQIEAAFHFLGPQLLDVAINGREASRNGNVSRRAAPHAAYKCRGSDRWCVIAVFNDREWLALRKVMGDPAWAREPRFGTLLGRLGNLADLDKHIEAWTSQRDPHDVMGTLQAAGVPAGVVAEGRDLVEDAQFASRGTFKVLEHAEIGAYTSRKSPVRYSNADIDIARPAPLLGQDSEYVLTKILGMKEEEFFPLLESGVVSIGS